MHELALEMGWPSTIPRGGIAADLRLYTFRKRPRLMCPAKRLIRVRHNDWQLPAGPGLPPRLAPLSVEHKGRCGLPGPGRVFGGMGPGSEPSRRTRSERLAANHALQRSGLVIRQQVAQASRLNSPPRNWAWSGMRTGLRERSAGVPGR